MTYNITFAGITLISEPEKFNTTIKKGILSKKFIQTPYLRFKNGDQVPFSEAECESSEIRTGTTKGIRAKYSNFRLPEDQKEAFGSLEAVLETEITTDGFVRVSVTLLHEPEHGIDTIGMQAIEFNAPKGTGYTILPRMQGLLLPAEYEKTIYSGEYIGYIHNRDAYMPVFGQVTDAKDFGAGNAYTMIIDTPYDAKYHFIHQPGGNTLITPLFVSSLGKIGYKRTILYKFEENCDYNRIAKIYRQYLRERGLFVTLKEKIDRNPNIAYLIGTPVVHSGIATHISPDSHYYDKDHPENNDYFDSFGKRADELRRLRESGVEKVYLHLDGWGNHGYDNLHPSPFPPHEAAGGTEGMKKLSDTCRELGYKFGIHDQYRDYYYDAPDFDMDNAVQNEDGSHPYCDVWYGGKHSWLCPKVAREYVRRNYDMFEELGIRIDGTYLDVFSVVEMDECFNPKHRITREECAKYRRECFELLNARGIITSSEETVDCIVPSIALCHHAPYFTSDLGRRSEIPGIPIPFFNLVWHDSMVIPWDINGSWGIPLGYDPYGLAFINGGTSYIGTSTTAENKKRVDTVLDLHKKVATRELLRHEIIDGDPKHQVSVFDSENGEIRVEVDFSGKNAIVTIE